MGTKARESQGQALGVLGARQSPLKHALSLLGACGGCSVHTVKGLLQPVLVLVVVAVHTGLERERDCIFLGIHLILNSAKGNTSGQGSPVS
jgi:hypothetical protein